MTPEDNAECAACGRTFSLDQLDGKPGPGTFTAAQLAAAADRGADFNRLECRGCYGPGFNGM